MILTKVAGLVRLSCRKEIVKLTVLPLPVMFDVKL